MANKTLFQSAMSPKITTNEAGGTAFSLSDKEALAQMVLTGVFSNTFYTNAEKQLERMKETLSTLSEKDSEFIAKLAVYARESGYMKDTPAFLTAWLSLHGKTFFKKVFNRVIDNGKMLRNFVQIMRSGVVGRKSLGHAPKTLVQNWITEASVSTLLRASVGNNPSLSDVIKMVHPKPKTPQQSELFKWLIGTDVRLLNVNLLPQVVKDLIDLRSGMSTEIPKVPFELLTSLNLTDQDWTEIAKNAGWHMTRMNLNTFARYGVFESPEMVTLIADRIRNPELIRQAKVFPYQIFTSYKHATAPQEILNALNDAMEIALENVPRYEGKIWVFVDVSGSMNSPVTGVQAGRTSKMMCSDVAGVFASALLRSNPHNTKVVLFDTKAHPIQLDPRAPVLKNIEIISNIRGGGTHCSVALEHFLQQDEPGDLFIYISDNQSWMENWALRGCIFGKITTETKDLWNQCKRRNPRAKMVCIDITPSATSTPVNTDKSTLNVGGFSDAVFDVISGFIESSSADFWVSKINQVIL